MEQDPLIRDLWFVTECSLEELANKIGLENAYYDLENYWEWVGGRIGDDGFNISRTHRLLPHESDTRIVVRSVSPRGRNILIERLQGLGITPIYLGSWGYIGNEEFEKIVYETIT